jgi:hypothetical protein
MNRPNGQTGGSVPAERVTTRMAAPPAVAGAESADLERTLQCLWYETLQRPWASLALLPADSSAVLGSLPDTLVALGQQYGETSLHVVDARGTRLCEVQAIVSELSSATRQVVLALDAAAENPASAHLVRASSAVLVVVRQGQSAVSAVRSAVSLAGWDRVLGAIMLT